MISIIIPAYNSADYLSETIATVLDQKYIDFELLIVDDGSQDETKSLVNKWMEKDSRIKYFYKENGGVSSARNLGIDKAQGTYLAFLDSDDTYEPDFLEKMHHRIRETDRLLCYCGYYQRSQGRILHAYPENFQNRDVLRYLIEEQWISTDSWLIRRDFLDRYNFRFNERLSYGEDFDFFGRLLYHAEGSCTFVAEYLTNYNFRPGSLAYKGRLWYPYAFMQGSLSSNKSFYTYIQRDGGPSSAYYASLMQQRIHQMYLRYLWGTLLLAPAREFRDLFSSYREDALVFDFSLPLPEKKYRIWQWIVTRRVGRMIGRCFFKPYKYMQRKLRTRKIK